MVYFLEHNLQIKRNVETFKYFSPKDQKFHNYLPDFFIDQNTYVEIKGWFNESAILKINEFKKNNPLLKLKIIDQNGIKPYLKYVKEKYGKNFDKILYEKSV